MSGSQEMLRGPAVLLLDPGDEVIDRISLLNFTVIQPRVTGNIGPCALEGCDGQIRQLSIPVQDPASGRRSILRVNVCTRKGCGSRMARSNGVDRRQIVTDQVRWLRQEGMPTDQIRRLHGDEAI